MKCVQHSSKTCCCGGHNSKNVKKNKKHNSTKSRMSILKNRRFKAKIKKEEG